MSRPQYGWVVVALVLVTLLAVQGLGYLTRRTNLRVCLELQRDTPDNATIAKLTNHYSLQSLSRGSCKC